MLAHLIRSTAFLLLGSAFFFQSASVAEESDRDRSDLGILEASEEPTQAIGRFRIPEGFEVSVWAAEPQLANPVAFCVDDQGRIYVAETFRHTDGVTDNRSHMQWLEDELAATTVEDRVAVYQKYLDDETFQNYSALPDRVRLIEDRDGDGRADFDSVFATDFDDVADGIGAGLLARDGNVWYTCIPDLWLLRDDDGDGKADLRKSLSTGYGVHVAFIGHDLHGLTFGPDGKLYFSIGDRGLNVVTAEGERIEAPHTGSVLRCDSDGSNLELFATGLRNPQELAFDRYGNLFTVDNNSDGGDRARFVHIVEGGDSGWRIGYQYIESPNARGPWNAENLWRPLEEGNDAAYLLPPLINVSDGPSGFTYNPGGAAMPARYDDHFFLADFRGTPGISGIRSFAVEPNGASFKMVDEHQFFWSILATDVDFGLDGGLLISDWVEGWAKPGKGRIYTLKASGTESDPSAAEVARLLDEGFSDRSLSALVDLLGHVDARIRQRAQFALASRGPDAIDALTEALGRVDEMARLHALWGLGQIGPEVSPVIIGATKDSSAAIRAQAAKILGGFFLTEESPGPEVLTAMVQLLADESAQVRFHAAIGLGKAGPSMVDETALESLRTMIRANNDRDPYLRHAGVMGLLGAATDEELATLGDDDDASVRLATLLVYRRQGNPEISEFLNDPDPRLVLEAARAINDVPIEGSAEKLSKLKVDGATPVPILRRVLNANLRIGGTEEANALAAMATNTDLPEAIRVEALGALADWGDPADLDRVVGLYRPIAPRSATPAAAALSPVIEKLLGDSPKSIRNQTAQAVGTLGITKAAPILLSIVEDPAEETAIRIAALEAMAQLEDDRLGRAARLATSDDSEELRAVGLRVLSKLDPTLAIPILASVLKDGALREQQQAMATLASLEGKSADQLIGESLESLVAGDLPEEIHLDLLEAAAERTDESIIEQLEAIEALRATGRKVDLYRECRAGGNALRGAQIFFRRTSAQCLRCHKVNDFGGEVGPEMSRIGAEKDRDYLLEAIVDPNARIATGYETLMVATFDGQVLSGIVRKETNDTLTMIDAEGKIFSIPTEEIEARRSGVSAMPETLLETLSKRDVRDLVEFLASLNGRRSLTEYLRQLENQ